MPDRVIDLGEIIANLEKWQANLLNLWIYPPGATEEEKAEQKAIIDDKKARISQRILTLNNICNKRQTSKVILQGLTPAEINQMDRGLDALSRPIQQGQSYQALMDTVTAILEGLTPIIPRVAIWTEPAPKIDTPGGGRYAPLDFGEGRAWAEVTHSLPKAKPAQRAKPLRKKGAPPRVVNTGFAGQASPDEPLNRKMPLRCGERYFFWLEIGPPQKGSIEETPVDIPAVPTEALLTVALFGFKGELEITPGADVGELKVQKDLAVCVTRQPLAESPPRSARLGQRLFFPVTAPGQGGEYRLRCHIYWGQILLQSQIIHALVRKQPQPVSRGQKALRSALDYTLSPTLQPASITKLQEHRLSIFMNSNGDGTHSFHIFGTDGKERFKRDDVRFKGGELQGMITQARGTLRLASWGNRHEWKEGIPYKYKDRKLNWDRLTKDLTNMAKWGYDFYDKICPRLAGNEQDVAEMEKALVEPGFIQLAMKESPSYVLPAALIYDYPLDTGAKSFTLCRSFAAALKQGQPLEDVECFQGKCPSRADTAAICPSGFWGFRHYLGMPLSVGKGPDMPPFIPVQQDLHLSMIVATNLELLQGHRDAVKALRALGSQTVWNYAEQRDEAFKVLKKSPHLVYFYCHGGLTRGKPYLQVGSGDQINPSNFRARKIQWEAPRPLVFINGCHTAAVEPLQALEFISPLVTYAHGAGVIGTEITIFEELATVFAEACLGRFLQGESIGAALRRARLRLLQEGNPLGLVYIPFVIATLALKDQGAAALSGLKPPKTGEVRVEEDKVWIGDTWVERRQG